MHGLKGTKQAGGGIPLVAKLRKIVPQRLDLGRTSEGARVIGEDQVPFRIALVRRNAALERGSEGPGGLLKEGFRAELFAPGFQQLRPVPAYPALGGFLSFAFDDAPKNAVTAFPTALPAAS